MNMLISMLIFLSISMGMCLLTIKTAKSNTVNHNKLTNFECGFNSSSTSMIPYSSQFFLIAILFLIFDLEITLFVPYMMSENMNCTSSIMSVMLMLILIIIFTLEWSMNLIKWSK